MDGLYETDVIEALRGATVPLMIFLDLLAVTFPAWVPRLAQGNRVYFGSGVEVVTPSASPCV